MAANGYGLGGISSASQSDNSAEIAQYENLMRLQIQRDFLKHHAHIIAKKTNTIPPELKDDNSLAEGRPPMESRALRETFLEKEIEDYRRYIKSQSNHNPLYTQAVLLAKIGSDEAGISRNLGQHFAQLFVKSGEAIASHHLPFVQLMLEEGLCFYWQSKEQADHFQKILGEHGIPGFLAAERLPPPHQHASYQTPNTTVVKIPHRYIEALLALAQYHPYYYEKVIRDLYKDKTDRATAILTEAQRESATVTPVQDPAVKVEQITRLSLDDKNDLIAIEVGTRAPATTAVQIPHLVLVLDDSGSMKGDKIAALSKALKTLIDSLDDDTLVSIQPLNMSTIAHRRPAKELKGKSWHIPTPGLTPLLETMAASALHFREHPLDLVIPQAEFNRTTMVVLTDGQPNGRSADTVEKLVRGMQESTGVGRSDAVAARDGVWIPMSFGSPSVVCSQLPVVLGFSIGADGDTQFMQDMAKRFATPQGFIRTEPQYIDEDMEQAVRLVGQMQGRYEKAFVGVTYTANGQIKGDGRQMPNLFYGFARCEFFTVPKDSPVQAALIHETSVSAGLPCASFAIQNSALMMEYVRSEFENLKQHYDRQSPILQGEIAPFYFDEEKVIIELGIERISKKIKQNVITRVGGFREVEIETHVIKEQIDYGMDAAAWSQQKLKLEQLRQRREAEEAAFRQKNAMTPLQQLKNSSIERMDVLISYLPEGCDSLKREMELYKKTILLPSSEQSFAPSGYASVTSSSSRICVAQFSQKRCIGHSTQDVSVVLSRELTPVLEAIGNADIETLKKALEKNPDLVNAVDEVGGTPLHSVLYHLRNAVAQKDMMRAAKLQAIVDYLIAHPEINLCQQNKNGSTAAHNAAWNGQTDILKAIIAKATERNQLDALVQVRNKQHVGGTVLGETLMDNVRLSRAIDDSTKQAILRSLTLKTAACNAHTEPHWNTPLMNMLYELKVIDSQPEPQKKNEKRQAILDYIEANQHNLRFHEANFNGNTALHFALWGQEYAIALAILNGAHAQGTKALQDVLVARNTVGGAGEVPHMNLVAQMHLLAKEEILTSVSEVLSYLAAWEVCFDLPNSVKAKVSTLFDKDDPIGSSIKILQLFVKTVKEPALVVYLQRLITQLEAIDCLMKTQTFIATHLDDSAKVELGHLYTVYQKQIEGYCALNFLVQSPLIQLNGDVQQLRATQGLPTELSQLIGKIDSILSKMDPQTIQQALQLITAWRQRNPLNPQTSSRHNFLTRVSIHLSHARAYHQKSAHAASSNMGFFPSNQNPVFSSSSSSSISATPQGSIPASFSSSSISAAHQGSIPASSSSSSISAAHQSSALSAPSSSSMFAAPQSSVPSLASSHSVPAAHPSAVLSAPSGSSMFPPPKSSSSQPSLVIRSLSKSSQKK